jgi:hypothetical protein
MPNIQICGFGAIAADQLKRHIDKVMQEIGLGNDAITSIVEMNAESCDGKRTKMPYLRICSTNAREIKKIIGALKKAKIKEDVEWLVLDGFIPAAKMV